MCEVVSREFKVIVMKHKGRFEDYPQLVPQRAQQFAKRMPDFSGTEVTVYEPKENMSHTEGTFYVGILVKDNPESLPEEMEFLDIQHSYGVIRGKVHEMGALYSKLDKWIDEKGYSRENYIIETYHPVENDIEEVEIYIPISS
ncbi:GyrI-like domain-containing protein [Mesobacillus jeotgali]|uniref:GyrI-like domain-containing protein n=1 Tax=Mesobacillus jeotgali TaxID=129985 RepID=UPI0009A7C014|nr:GyrI-like domain-containing protein [Mesobacillus jeotgali]